MSRGFAILLRSTACSLTFGPGRRSGLVLARADHALVDAVLVGELAAHPRTGRVVGAVAIQLDGAFRTGRHHRIDSLLGALDGASGRRCDRTVMGAVAFGVHFAHRNRIHGTVPLWFEVPRRLS